MSITLPGIPKKVPGISPWEHLPFSKTESSENSVQFSWDISRYYRLPPASITSLTTQWKVCLSFKHSYPRCSTLIQAIDKVGMQYDPRFEVPDSSKRLPVLLLKKLQQLLQNLTMNHWENKTSRKSAQHRKYRSLDLIFHLLCVFLWVLINAFIC